MIDVVIGTVKAYTKKLFLREPSEVEIQPSLVVAPVVAALTQAPLKTPFSIGSVRTSMGLTTRVFRLNTESFGVVRKRIE